MSPTSIDREKAKQNPESVFDSPQSVVEEVLLTKGEKIATLNRWRQTVLEELSASGEGMRTYGVFCERARLLERIEDARGILSADGQ